VAHLNPKDNLKVKLKLNKKIINLINKQEEFDKLKTISKIKPRQFLKKTIKGFTDVENIIQYNIVDANKQDKKVIKMISNMTNERS
jgi:hypothetical protein